MAKSSTARGFALSIVTALVVVAPLHGAVIDVDGVCTLVDAITAAETDTATGSCPAGLWDDEIHLLVDVELTSVNNSFLGDNGLPVVTTGIVIEGAGHTISRAPGALDFRLFFVDYGGTLVLIDTTLSNGSVPSDDGGAIYGRSRLTLLRTTVSGNTALFGGGVMAQGTASIIDSTISQNTAASGGGLTTGASTALTITGSTFSGNQSTNGDGGGIQVFRSDALIAESIISGNYAMFSGGGIVIAGGSVVLSDSTVSANSADGCAGGGGIAVSGTYNTGSASVTNSTLSGNTAPLGGGIAAIDDASAALTNTTICGNSASNIGGGVGTTGVGMVQLSASLVAHSPSGGNCAGVIDGGGNLADDTTCGTIPGTLTGLDPVLGNHGGPTMTHSLDPGSNAIDLAVGGPSTDQRRFMRTDGGCDAGSFELSAFDPLEIFADDFEHGSCWGWSSAVS